MFHTMSHENLLFSDFLMMKGYVHTWNMQSSM